MIVSVSRVVVRRGSRLGEVCKSVLVVVVVVVVSIVVDALVVVE